MSRPSWQRNRLHPVAPQLESGRRSGHHWSRDHCGRGRSVHSGDAIGHPRHAQAKLVLLHKWCLCRHSSPPPRHRLPPATIPVVYRMYVRVILRGWPEAGMSLPSRGCIGLREAGPSRGRRTAANAAPRWGQEKSSSALPNADATGRTEPTIAVRAAPPTSRRRSEMPACSSRWTSAICARCARPNNWTSRDRAGLQ